MAIVSLQKKYVLCANTFVKTLLILNLYVDGVCSISGTGFWFAQNEVKPVSVWNRFVLINAEFGKPVWNLNWFHCNKFAHRLQNQYTYTICIGNILGVIWSVYPCSFLLQGWGDNFILMCMTCQVRKGQNELKFQLHVNL